jgi:protein tyrosine/serine phosphatase
MLAYRALGWEGCFNVRDLGGFRTAEGQETRWGALVRADGLSRLTDKGWKALESHGVRTIVDLRNEDEIEPDIAARPQTLTTKHMPIDDPSDTEFWQHIWSNELDGTPLYYQPFLEQKAKQCADAVTAIAEAPPGGVVFHCSRGRDRTGLVALAVLTLVGVSAEEIATDYEMSTDGVRLIDAALGEPDQATEIAGILARKETSARALIFDLLETINLEEQLRRGGLQEDTLEALRERFLSK